MHTRASLLYAAVNSFMSAANHARHDAPISTPPTRPRAWREAHAHLIALGQSMRRLDLSRCADIHDCLQSTARAASEARVIHNSTRSSDPHSPTPWLIAWGLRPQAWPDPRWPSMRELDGACSDIPCFIAGFDHHSAACNTRAFTLLGYDNHSPDPVGGTIVRDRSGAPTGLLLEAAYTRARERLPQPSRHEARTLITTACSHLASLGCVEVHDLLAQDWLGPVLAEIWDAETLSMPVGVFVPMDPSENFATFDAAVRAAAAWQRPKVRLLGGKVFADGTLNSATAAMLTPYREPIPHAPNGQLFMDKDTLVRTMRHLASLADVWNPHRPTLAVHAIGDRAVRTVLDAYQEVGGLARSGISLRIEHAEIIDAADVPRFVELGVVASVQPCHLLYDIEVLRRQFPGRLDRVLPLREMIDAGLKPGESLIFGSDVPIVRAEPEDSILAATQRRRLSMPPSEAIAPHHAITPQEALACFGSTD